MTNRYLLLLEAVDRLKRALYFCVDSEELGKAVTLYSISSGPDFSGGLKSKEGKEVYNALQNCSNQMYRNGKYFELWTQEQKEDINW